MLRAVGAPHDVSVHRVDQVNIAIVVWFARSVPRILSANLGYGSAVVQHVALRVARDGVLCRLLSANVSAKFKVQVFAIGCVAAVVSFRWRFAEQRFV